MATLILRPISDITKAHTAGKEGDNSECDGSSSTMYNMLNEVTADDKTTIIGHHGPDENDTVTEFISQVNLTAFSLNKWIKINSITPFIRWRNDQTGGTAEAYLTVVINNENGKESGWTSGGSSYTSYHDNSETYTASQYFSTDTFYADSNLKVKLTIRTRCGSSNYKSRQDVNITQTYVTIDYTEVPAPGGSFIWMKMDGAWQNCKSLWIKQNGTWVKQTTPPTGYSGLIRKHNPWTFDKAFRQGSIVDDTTWLISDYIAVTPDVELIVTGQGGDVNNTMWQAYYADKTCYDYWGGSGTVITTIGGKNVYQRTLSASNMANTYWVRVGALKEAWDYIKVQQSGVVLFDGSQYPYT